MRPVDLQRVIIADNRNLEGSQRQYCCLETILYAHEEYLQKRISSIFG